MHIRKSLLLLAACQVLSACSDTAELRNALEEAEAERDKLRRELQMRELEATNASEPKCRRFMRAYQASNGQWIYEPISPEICN